MHPLYPFQVVLFGKAGFKVIRKSTGRTIETYGGLPGDAASIEEARVKAQDACDRLNAAYRPAPALTVR